MGVYTDLNQKGKRYSFFQLFKEHNYKIEIPIIQRDFAQGRKSKTEVRNLFLQALYAYLDENIPNRDLDFVYGSTEFDNEIKKFIPLDGKQRLTTLFLLHWYLANVSGNSSLLKSILFDKNSKFTYLTRTSSSEFCDALFENELDLKNLLINKKTKKESLSDTIKDSAWYFLSWGKDPTIQSMLVMLDAIHEVFFMKGDFFNRLVDVKSPIITFLYMDLGEFGLTEDLYIKMNSRGKPLTTFENFKAKLEQHISQMETKPDGHFSLEFNNLKKQVTIQEYFSFNIDTKWADLFWQYRELGEDKNTFDDQVMNFIYVIALNQYAIERDFKKDVFTLLNKAEHDNSGIPEYISYNKLNSLEVLTKDFLIYLTAALDNLSNGNSKIRIHLPNNFYFDETDIFTKALTNRLSWTTRVQFHAYIRFLIIYKENKSRINQWMRFVHNITENTRIEVAEDFVRAIKSIEKIIPYGHDILSFLINDSNHIDFFYSRQIQEERIKASLLLKSKEWQIAIENCELKAFFKGQIGFLLEFSGILSYYELHLNCSWSVEEDSIFFRQFTNYAVKAASAFEILHTKSNENYLIERAVLTKGNYLIPAGNNKYNLLSTNRDLRDYGWKRLLRIPPTNDDDSKKWKQRRRFVKDLFDDRRFHLSNIKESLGLICMDKIGGWLQYFIDKPELIRYCQQGFIQKISDFEIYLILQFQDNSRKRELFSYNLYLNNKDIEYAPFEYLEHIEINRGNADSFMKLSNWCYNRKYYSINIYYTGNDDNTDGGFHIIFYKAKGEKQITDYATEIVALLEARKFKWDEEDLKFKIKRRNENTTSLFLKELCAELVILENE